MKNLRQYIRYVLLETLPLDVEVGDVILTGKFKNKRKIVKSIGKDKYGQPTINGKSILKFKIEKHLPKDKWSAKSKEELKEFKLINEGMKMPADLPDGAYIEVNEDKGQTKIIMMWPEDRSNMYKAGTVEYWAGEDFACDGANEVSWAFVRPEAEGFGPLLYDIALELSGETGLIFDHESLSDEAADIWKYYFKNRPDVVTSQLDAGQTWDYEKQWGMDKPFRLTPEDSSDDCPVKIYHKFNPTARDTRMDSAEYKEMFLDHWATKKYIKKGGTPILDALGDKVRYV